MTTASFSYEILYLINQIHHNMFTLDREMNINLNYLTIIKTNDVLVYLFRKPTQSEPDNPLHSNDRMQQQLLAFYWNLNRWLFTAHSYFL